MDQPGIAAEGPSVTNEAKFYDDVIRAQIPEIVDVAASSGGDLGIDALRTKPNFLDVRSPLLVVSCSSSVVSGPSSVVRCLEDTDGDRVTFQEREVDPPKIATEGQNVTNEAAGVSGSSSVVSCLKEEAGGDLGGVVRPPDVARGDVLGVGVELAEGKRLEPVDIERIRREMGEAERMVEEEIESLPPEAVEEIELLKELLAASREEGKRLAEHLARSP